MAVTKTDIGNKEFSTKSKGYDQYEVDVFLDEIIDTLNEKDREIESLQSKCSELYEKINSYKSMDASLVELYAIAKMKSDEIVVQANRQAEEIINAAKEKGDSMLAEVNAELEQLKGETEKVQNEYQIFRIKFEALLQNQLNLLHHEEAAAGLEPAAEGAEAEAAKAEAAEDTAEAEAAQTEEPAETAAEAEAAEGEQEEC